MSDSRLSALQGELDATRRELEEAKAVIAALRAGEADAIVVDTAAGPKVYALRSADEPYRTIVETLNEGALTVGRGGVVLYCNAALAQLVGRDSASLVGRPLADALGTSVAAEIESNGTARSFECSIPRNDASRRDCLVSVVPHAAEDETIFCLLVTDLTGQALRLRHNAIIEFTDDAVISLDRAGRITTWNRAAEALFGYTVDDAIGQDAAMLVAPLAQVPEGETIRGAFEAALSGRSVRKNTQRVAKNGTVIDVNVTATQIRTPEGQVIGVSAIMRDIRERKQAAESLRMRNRQLDLLARTAERLLLSQSLDNKLLESIFADIGALLGMEMFYHYRPSGTPHLLALMVHGGITDEERRVFSTMKYGELLCGRVAQTQKRLIVEDLQHCEQPGSEVLRAGGATSYAGFPLVSNGSLIGTIAFISRARTRFREDEIQTVQAICDQIAGALERARLQHALQDVERLKAFLLELSDALRPLSAAPEIQAEAARILAEEIGASRTAYYEVDSDSYVIGTDHTRGVPSLVGRYSVASFGRDLLERHRRGEPIVVGDVRTVHSEAEVESFHAIQIDAYIGVPLVKSGQFIAGFTVQSSTPRDWTQTEVRMVEEAAERTWAAVERAKAEERLRESERQLAIEVKDLLRLHALSVRLAGSGELRAVLDDVLRTAADLTGARLGTVQTHTRAGTLEMVEQTGFGPSIIEAFGTIRDCDWSTCAVALRTKSRVVVPDIRSDPAFTDIAAVLAPYGAVAAISSPLIDSHGTVSAMFSLYWDAPREPTERDLRLLDLCTDLARRHVERNAAAEALRASEELLRTVLSSTPDLVWAKDRAGRITLGNEATFRLLGNGKAERVLGGDAHDLVPDPEQARVIEENDRRVLQEGASVFVEESFTKDGEERLYQTVKSPLRNAGGDIVGIVGVSRDITQKNRLESALRESENRFRILADSAPVLIWVNDESGCVSVNRAYREFLGVGSDSDVRGYDWSHYVHPEDRDRYVDAYVEAAARTSVFNAEFRFRRHDNVYRWMRSVAIPRLSANGSVLGYVGATFDIHDTKQAVDALRAAHNTFRHLVEQSPFGIYTVNADFRLVQVSAGAQNAFRNVHPLLERDFAEVIRTIWPEPFASEVIARFRHTLTTGEPYHARGTVSRRVDKDVIEAYDWQIERITLLDGRPGVVCHFYDLSERQRAEEREHMLMREVNHRAKNMLGLVQAIARQTAAKNPQEFVQRFEQRVQALAASQDLLVKSNWSNVPIEDLVRAQLAYFGDLIGSRILLSGPLTKITAAAAQAIGLALHELATNAAKYGALANDTGTVTVSWRVDDHPDGPRFSVSWIEAGGPPVAEPQRRGFGSMVTGSLVKTGLDCDVATDFAPEGLRWQLSCAAHKVIDAARQGREPRTEALPTNTGRSAGASPSVLVVEDEPLIALEIAATLEDAGFQVLGPVNSVAQAMNMLNSGSCDAAILDVNLGSETAEPIAATLMRAGTPFVIISGYGREQLPGALNTAPLVGKPIRHDRLLDVLRQSISPSGPLH